MKFEKKEREYEKKTKTINVSNKNIAIAVLIILGVCLTFLVSIPHMFQKKEFSFKMKAEVLNFTKSNVTKLGVDVDPNILNFGRIPLTGNVTKMVNVQIKTPYKVLAKIRITGNISKYIVVENKRFVFEGNVKKKIKVKFVGAKIGNYTGTFYIDFLIPKYSFAQHFLNLADKLNNRV